MTDQIPYYLHRVPSLPGARLQLSLEFSKNTQSAVLSRKTSLRRYYPKRIGDAEIDRVMRAVFDLGPDADPAEVKKLYAMLKPGDPFGRFPLP